MLVCYTFYVELTHNQSLDCVLTTHKMHNMITFPVNISIIVLFICKKKQEKNPIISKHNFYKKNHLKSIRADNFQDISVKF